MLKYPSQRSCRTSSFRSSVLVQRLSLASDANGHLKSSPKDDSRANKLHLLTEKRVMRLKAELFLHQTQRTRIFWCFVPIITHLRGSVMYALMVEITNLCEAFNIMPSSLCLLIILFFVDCTVFRWPTQQRNPKEMHMQAHSHPFFPFRIASAGWKVQPSTSSSPPLSLTCQTSKRRVLSHPGLIGEG